MATIILPISEEKLLGYEGSRMPIFRPFPRDLYGLFIQASPLLLVIWDGPSWTLNTKL